jgi:hypothetical protein
MLIARRDRGARLVALAGLAWDGRIIGDAVFYRLAYPPRLLTG